MFVVGVTKGKLDSSLRDGPNCKGSADDGKRLSLDVLVVGVTKGKFNSSLRVPTGWPQLVGSGGILMQK